MPETSRKITVPEVRRLYGWARQGDEAPPKVALPASALARGEGVSAAAVSAALRKLADRTSDDRPSSQVAVE